MSGTCRLRSGHTLSFPTMPYTATGRSVAWGCPSGCSLFGNTRWKKRIVASDALRIFHHARDSSVHFSHSSLAPIVRAHVQPAADDCEVRQPLSGVCKKLPRSSFPVLSPVKQAERAREMRSARNCFARTNLLLTFQPRNVILGFSYSYQRPIWLSYRQLSLRGRLSRGILTKRP